VIKGTRSEALKQFALNVMYAYDIIEEDVEINFEDRHWLVPDAYGYTSYDDSNVCIDIYRNAQGRRLTFDELRISLLHELTHAKQFLKGELQYTDKVGTMVWKGCRYEGIPAHEQPWEIEAYSVEKDFKKFK